uniref:Tc1-like transposase DDE domain-containing protein n=1 Tax=Panagrolaimus davidi TaxID=227884 RepID=A0A914PYM1_9BILA
METRSQILRLRQEGLSSREVAAQLGNVSHYGVLYTERRANATQAIFNRPHEETISRDVAVNRIIDEAIVANRNATIQSIRARLQTAGYERSEEQIRRRIHHTGRRYVRTKYAQTISIVNQQKRLRFREFVINSQEYFYNHIFVDETMILINDTNRFEWRFRDERPRKRPRFAHPKGLWLFGGISRRGATGFSIYQKEHRNEKVTYCEMIGQVIYPFMKSRYNMNCHLVQDNAKMHTANYTKHFLQRLGIRRHFFPPQSPDFNPIEKIWRALKAYLRQLNPRTLFELKKGILDFHKNELNVQLCNTVIDDARRNILRAVDGLNHEGESPTNELYRN